MPAPRGSVAPGPELAAAPCLVALGSALCDREFPGRRLLPSVAELLTPPTERRVASLEIRFLAREQRPHFDFLFCQIVEMDHDAFGFSLGNGAPGPLAERIAFTVEAAPPPFKVR